MVVDHSSHHEQVDGFDLLTTEQRAAARRTVAGYSEDAEECRMFFDMLGILPRQERDDPPEVTRPKLPKATPVRRNQKLKRF